MSAIRLPRLVVGQDPADYLNRLVLTLEQALNSPVAGRPYIISNASALRALDVSTATLPELRRVVATMVADLQAGGHLP